MITNKNRRKLQKPCCWCQWAKNNSNVIFVLRYTLKILNCQENSKSSFGQNNITQYFCILNISKSNHATTYLLRLGTTLFHTKTCKSWIYFCWYETCKKATELGQAISRTIQLKFFLKYSGSISIIMTIYFAFKYNNYMCYNDKTFVSYLNLT